MPCAAAGCEEQQYSSWTLPDDVRRCRLLGVPLDGPAHIRARRLAVAEGSTYPGWDTRTATNEKAKVLEYYVLPRRLRFERFKIELPEYLLGALNEALARLGKGDVS